MSVSVFPADTVLLNDGTSLYFRPISAEDTPHLIDIFDHLSSESRYQRFQQVVDHFSATQVQTYAERTVQASVEAGYGILAFLASDTGDSVPVAGIRYVVEDERGISAEFAITIRDDMHRRGIGSLLLNRLIIEARNRGLRYLTGSALAENIAIWKLLTRTGLPLDRWYDDGDMKFSLCLYSCCTATTEPDRLDTTV